jgi:hypothetical protein
MPYSTNERLTGYLLLIANQSRRLVEMLQQFAQRLLKLGIDLYFLGSIT